MGTSASSKGPGGGVPMVPPWVPPVPPPGPEESPGAPPEPQTPIEPGQPPPQPAGVPAPVAPAKRFGAARLNLGKFGSGGDRRHMLRGLQAYVRKGYGGRNSATSRFGGTAATAGVLNGALANVAAGRPATPGSPLDPVLLSGRTARQVMDAIVEAVRPADGTQDAEAGRAAIKDALSELLTLFPDADLLNLSDEQRETAIESFVASDVYRRIALDVGLAIQAKAPTPSAGLARLKEVKDYVRQTVAAAFRRLGNAGARLSTGRVAALVRSVIDETLKVFEEYRR